MYSKMSLFSPKSSTLAQILKPKKSGLTASLKPVAFIVGSPHDPESNSINYKVTKTFLETAGYQILNKKACVWNVEDVTSYCGRSDFRGKTLTVWIAAHGCPAWFFGEESSFSSELAGIIQVRNFLKQIAATVKIPINSVVLSGCYTANEIVSETTDDFNFSPARMLSIYMPKVNVVGFIGQNADAKITHIYMKDSAGDYAAVMANPEDASVLYRNGTVVESPLRELYCDHGDTPGFLKDALSLGDVTEKHFYHPRNVLEESLSEDSAIKGYAELQWHHAITYIGAERESLSSVVKAKLDGDVEEDEESISARRTFSP